MPFYGQKSRYDEKGEDHVVTGINKRRIWRAYHGSSRSSLWRTTPLAHRYRTGRNAAPGISGATGKTVARSGSASGYQHTWCPWWLQAESEPGRYNNG